MGKGLFHGKIISRSAEKRAADRLKCWKNHRYVPPGALSDEAFGGQRRMRFKKNGIYLVHKRNFYYFYDINKDKFVRRKRA